MTRSPAKTAMTNIATTGAVSTGTAKTAIELRDVGVSLGGRAIFQGADLALERGSFTLIQGPSGAGKSTLLRLMNRLEEPSSGTVFVLGKPLHHWSAPDLRRTVAYIQQTPTTVSGSVRHNLLLPFSFKANAAHVVPTDRELDRLMARFLLDGVTLSDTAASCSVGQRQRLCLIRSLLLRPEILLLDEPVSGLDPDSRAVVEDMAEELCVEQSITVVLITHQGFSPRRTAPRTISVCNGRVQPASLLPPEHSAACAQPEPSPPPQGGPE